METSANLIVTGVGGQGNVLAAKVLAGVALNRGFEVTVGDVYGLTQRGGSVASHVRWTKDRTLPPLVPKGTLDVLVAFEPLEALRIQAQFGHLGTVALVNDAPIMPLGVQAGRFSYPREDSLWSLLDEMTARLWRIPGSEVARNLGNIQVLNMVMLGALCGSGVVGFQAGAFEEVIHEELPQELRAINQEAFRQGLGLCHQP